MTCLTPVLCFTGKYRVSSSEPSTSSTENTSKAYSLLNWSTASAKSCNSERTSSRQTQKVPGSHQEADCFILTELCLGEFFWSNHFWLMCKAGKLRDEEFYKVCQSQKRPQGFEGLHVQERTLGVKNSQSLSGCLALCSTEIWIAVLHTVVVQWIWYSPVHSLNDPKGLCRYTNTSQLLSCPRISLKGPLWFPCSI